MAETSLTPPEWRDVSGLRRDAEGDSGAFAALVLRLLDTTPPLATASPVRTGWHEWIGSPHAGHAVHESVTEERCSVCLRPATHKIETSPGPPGVMHELSSYLCCAHTSGIGLGRCAVPAPPTAIGGE